MRRALVETRGSRRSRTERWRLIKATAACFAVLAGCQREPTQESDVAAPGGTILRRGLGAEPETLHPHLAVDNASLAVVQDLYEGLTTEDADGRIVAAAARSWEVSSDGLTWTFHVRTGLRWSNGDVLDATQFAASLHAAITPGSSAPNAGLFARVLAVDAPNSTTVTLRLAQPIPYLAALLALPIAAPMHGGDAEPGSTTNGPYRLVSRSVGDRIELERNPYYRDADAVAVDHVVHLAITDLATELKLYRTGELDVTSEVPNAQLEWIRGNLADQLEIAPYLSTYAYSFNLARLPDARVRRALAMTVDRDRLTRQVTGAGELAAFGWVPDGIPGYSAARFDWQSLPREQAVAEARALWAAAATAGSAPARLTLCTDASANHHRTAVAVADFWRTTLGIETAIVELEWNVYLDTRRHPGDCDLVRLGWSADFVDPEAFAAVFESDHPQNTLGYASSAYDAFLQRSRTMAEASSRYRLLAEAEATLLADPPMAPLFFRVSKRLIKPYVEGYRANPLGHVASRYLRVRPH